MSFVKTLQVSLLCAGIAALGTATTATAAEQWHFVVKNASSSTIKTLEVSVDQKEWGNFAIGKGIAPGAKETLVWDSSTDNEDCEQYIRAKFADGSVSGASKQDFCEDLDVPIEFTD